MVEKSDNVKDSSKLKFYTLLVHEELYAGWRNEIPTRSDNCRSLPKDEAWRFRCPETIYSASTALRDFWIVFYPGGPRPGVMGSCQDYARFMLCLWIFFFDWTCTPKLGSKLVSPKLDFLKVFRFRSHIPRASHSVFAARILYVFLTPSSAFEARFIGESSPKLVPLAHCRLDPRTKIPPFRGFREKKGASKLKAQGKRGLV